MFYILIVMMIQFSLVAQSCPTLCDPMHCSTPGLPVHRQLPEFIQTHVHRVGDAIQPSHSLIMVMAKFKAKMKVLNLNPVFFSLEPQYGLEAVDRNSRASYPLSENY